MGRYRFINDSGVDLSEMGKTGASSTERAGGHQNSPMVASNPAASERLEKMIHDHHFEIENLSVVVEANTVHLSGKAKDQETKEKIILLLGNIHGIEEVNEKVEVEQAAPESQFHTVAQADTLEIIAKNIFGDIQKSQEIINANKPMIQSAADIYPGQVLRIPNREEPR